MAAITPDSPSLDPAKYFCTNAVATFGLSVGCADEGTRVGDADEGKVVGAIVGIIVDGDTVGLAEGIIVLVVGVADVG